MGTAFSVSGKAFRAQLCQADVRRLRVARACWFGTMFVPPALYYAGLGREKPVFPATISWAAREGIPKWGHHVFWLAGWATFYSVVHRRGDALLRAFSLQMIATGVVSIILCPVGCHGTQDVVHSISAAAYMADHHPFFRIMGVGTGSMLAFWACFASFLGSTAFAQKLEKRFKQEGPKAQQTALCCGVSARDCLWYTELVRMICENGLFAIFLAGFMSGLRRKP